MNVGLPGAGLGGLFFLVCALLTIPIELVRTLLGRGSRARWKRAVHHTTLAGLVVTVLGGTYWVLQLALRTRRPPLEAAPLPAERFPAGVDAPPIGNDVPATGMSPQGLSPLDTLPVAPILMTLAVLALILGLTFVLNRVTHRSANVLRVSPIPAPVPIPLAEARRSARALAAGTGERDQRTSRSHAPAPPAPKRRPLRRWEPRDHDSRART